MRPIKDFIVIKPDPMVAVSTGGIIIPESARRNPKKGTIVAVGPQCELPLKADDTVLFEPNAGNNIEYRGQKLLILRPASIWALMEIEV